MLAIHKESHLDHAISPSQLEHIQQRLASGDQFSIDTFELLAELGQVPCGLYGPSVGDPPVLESEVSYQARNGRPWPTRTVARPARMTSVVTVIRGPHDGLTNVLYTAFGGPAAPQEPDDPGCKDQVASEAFWKDHALSNLPAA